MSKKLFLLLGIVCILNACSNDPMQKLASNVRYDDMNTGFWAKQKDQNQQLWNKAVNYCQQHNEKPNCGPVMNVYVISNGSTKVPAYGTSGHYLNAPNF